MINQAKTYPDKATFDADFHRLIGMFLQFKIAVQSQRIKMKKAAGQSVEGGFISPEDDGMVRLALLGNLGKASGPSD